MTPVLLALLATLAAAMATSTAVFVRWAANCTSSIRAAIVVFLLLMMTGMLCGALVYELAPAARSAVAGLWIASVVMSASAGVVFVAFAREAVRFAGGATAPKPFAPTAGFVGVVVGVVLLNEGLMGWTFGLAAGALSRHPAGGLGGGVGMFSAVVVTPWFTFPMVVEMLLTITWLRSTLPSTMRRLLLAQPAVMLCSPPTLHGLAWLLGSTLGASAAMSAAVAYLVLLIHRGERVPRGVALYSARLLLAFGLMGGGLATWALGGPLAIFAIAIAVQMVVFLDAVIAPPAPPDGGGRRPTENVWETPPNELRERGDGSPPGAERTTPTGAVVSTLGT